MHRLRNCLNIFYLKVPIFSWYFKVFTLYTFNLNSKCRKAFKLLLLLYLLFCIAWQVSYKVLILFHDDMLKDVYIVSTFNVGNNQFSIPTINSIESKTPLNSFIPVLFCSPLRRMVNMLLLRPQPTEWFNQFCRLL